MDNNALDALLSQCWLDTTFLPIQSTNSYSLTDNKELCIASIIFSGESQGSFTIAMEKELATKVASKMFDCDLDSVSYDDIRDSVGELVNVLSGNIKTDLFNQSELSKPLVMQGDDSIFSALGADIIFQKSFISDNDKQLVIQICQTD